MRVSSLTLKDIGPFEDAVLEIPPPEEGQRGELVLFEGPNGSGKTTIAQAIACAAEPERLPSYGDRLALYPPIEDLRRRARSSSNVEVSTTITNQEETLIVRDPRPHAKWRSNRGDHVPETLIDAFQRAAEGHDDAPLKWAAFAYQGHLPTPIVATKGPTDIESPPLRGALSFGAVDPASAHFGQLLVNLDYEVAKALKNAHQAGISPDRKDEHLRLAASRQAMLDQIAGALSKSLDRAVRFEFPFGQHTPTILVDEEPIPIDLLGEGMRSTFAWLSDLLVRLHRIRWERQDISPLEQDFWLILDEIDESLHPTAQMRILPALRDLFPNARMYVTTHSPFVVASVGEGWVFSIRTGERRRVSGTIAPRKLVPGQSLEWVVEEVFGAETGIIDAETRDALKQHRADVARLRKKEPFGDDQWQAFLERRQKLMSLTEEVRSIVAMQEVPVQERIDEHLAQAAE